MRDYRSALNAHLLPAFGSEPIEAITAEAIEGWRRSLAGLSNRSKTKPLIQRHGIFRRAQMVWGLPVNPRVSGDQSNRQMAADAGGRAVRH